MVNIRTVFKIGFGSDDFYAVAGSGQEAAQRVRSQFPQKKIVLHGFYIGEQFVKPYF